MKLNKLYKHRTDFTIIGLTGRTGSGCTQLAEFLSEDFSKLQMGLRKPEEFTDPIFKRKYEIVRQFLSYQDNWQKFEVIHYKNLLLFYILKHLHDPLTDFKELLEKYYRERKDEENFEVVATLLPLIVASCARNVRTLAEIKKLPDVDQIRSEQELTLLNEVFFGEEFKILSEEIFEILESGGYYRRTCLLHHVACNIRSSKCSNNDMTTDPDNVYIIAELLNSLIKAKKHINQGAPTKIVIDSLRNSLEVSFFKERYSAFYMLATKDVLNNAAHRLNSRLESKITNSDERARIVKEMLDLDETEYKSKDFSNGKFSSPNVEHCIQKSDFHIFNLKQDQVPTFISRFEKYNDLSEEEIKKLKNTFLTREEQLCKFIALVHHPGLITPSASERNMQIATTAKLNSGCISRQVGAVITDVHFVAKSIGWNDVAKGHTPCNLRNVEDFFSPDLNLNVHYSEFEKGAASSGAEYKYKSGNPSNFKEAIIDYFGDKIAKHSADLSGKNCSFCFKTIHNYYEGDSNQVHTRSLHAEENAMLQLTKSGGFGVEKGFLFTTASPCELCSKKAYQLGIRIIFYIDPYPGIAIDQILSGGSKKPILLPFSGATGNAYHWLYEPHLSPKDEITMTLELTDKNVDINHFKRILKKMNPSYQHLDKVRTIGDVELIMNEGISKFDEQFDEDYSLSDK